MIKINKSTIAAIPNFSDVVAAYAKELSDWTANMARVADDEKNNVEAKSRHVKYPRPRALQAVELAVDENCQPSFEIVDDGPTSEQIFAAKKNHLLAKVSEDEQDATAKVIAPGKRRFLAIRETELNSERMAIANRLSTEGRSFSSDTDRQTAINDFLCRDDQEFLKRCAEVRNKLDAISRTAALMQHDIEDLTEADIDAWQMTPFEV